MSTGTPWPWQPVILNRILRLPFGLSLCACSSCHLLGLQHSTKAECRPLSCRGRHLVVTLHHFEILVFGLLLGFGLLLAGLLSIVLLALLPETRVEDKPIPLTAAAILDYSDVRLDVDACNTYIQADIPPPTYHGIIASLHDENGCTPTAPQLLADRCLELCF